MADKGTVQKNEKTYTVAGYTFNSKEEAQEAKDELNAIKYVSAKTDGKDPKQVYLLYNTILDKELFKTAVGLDYLKELQQFLYIHDEIPNDKIRPIPINSELRKALGEKREFTKVRGEMLKLRREVDKYKDRSVKLIIVNVVLLLVILAMVVILKTSSTPTIIDYENKLQDKYASWQEQLQSQEASLRDRENELR